MIKTTLLLLLLFVSDLGFAQRNAKTERLKGVWKIHKAGRRCAKAFWYNSNEVPWTTRFLSFNNDGTVGSRTSRNPGILGGTLGKYKVEGKTLTLDHDLELLDFNKPSDKPIKIRKAGSRNLRLTHYVLLDFTKGEEVREDTVYLCEVTALYHRVKDVSKVLNVSKVGDLWVENSEVLNAHWLEYEKVQKQALGPKGFAKSNIESSFASYLNPGEGFYPMTMVTYEQVVDFCKWRSDYMSKVLGRKVKYRLPTLREWQKIARQLFMKNESKVTKQLLSNKEQRLTIFYQNKLFAFFSNPYGKKVVHMFDNVSEMTATRGQAVGGNNNLFLSPNDNLRKVFNYAEPQFFLGFRCIVEFEE